MRGMDELVCELLDNFGNLACTRENGSAGLQCDKIVDFLEGTLGLSANLPKNPQSLHSHTANTNFAACSSNPTESTPRQEGKPSAECKADSESKESLDSESKQLTESTTSKNPSEALPDSKNSACGSTSRAESMLIDSAIFAQQKSNQKSRAEHPQKASSGWERLKSSYPPAQIGSDFARVAKPLAHTCTFKPLPPLA